MDTESQLVFTIRNLNKHDLIEEAQHIVELFADGFERPRPTGYVDSTVGDMQIRVFGYHRRDEPQFYMVDETQLVVFDPTNHTWNAHAQNARDCLVQQQATQQPGHADGLESAVIVGSAVNTGISYIQERNKRFVDSLFETSRQAIASAEDAQNITYGGLRIAKPLTYTSQVLFVSADNAVERFGTDKHHLKYLPRLDAQLRNA